MPPKKSKYHFGCRGLKSKFFEINIYHRNTWYVLIIHINYISNIIFASLQHWTSSIRMKFSWDFDEAIILAQSVPNRVQPFWIPLLIVGELVDIIINTTDSQLLFWWLRNCHQYQSNIWIRRSLPRVGRKFWDIFHGWRMLIIMVVHCTTNIDNLNMH